MNKKNYFEEIIIGAGPAGLTAGYELVQSKKSRILIIEKNNQVGGLASTKVFGEYRYDIGPHRFFTKNEEIDSLFLKILGNDAVKVNRLTRIYYKKKYFNNYSSAASTGVDSHRTSFQRPPSRSSKILSSVRSASSASFQPHGVSPEL